jgi:hypothetical protein
VEKYCAVDVKLPESPGGNDLEKTLPKGDPLVYVFVEGVPDPKYQPRGWWRQRLYVETWLSESAKLAWASL